MHADLDAVEPVVPLGLRQARIVGLRAKRDDRGEGGKRFHIAILYGGSPARYCPFE